MVSLRGRSAPPATPPQAMPVNLPPTGGYPPPPAGLGYGGGAPLTQQQPQQPQQAERQQLVYQPPDRSTKHARVVYKVGDKAAETLVVVANQVDSAVANHIENRVERARSLPPEERNHRQVSERHMAVAKTVDATAQTAAYVATAVSDTVNGVAKKVGGVVAPKAGKDPGLIRAYPIAVVSAVDGVRTAAFDGAKQVTMTASKGAKEYVEVMHGEDAGQLAGHYGSAANHSVKAATSASKCTPSAIGKSMAKAAGRSKEKKKK